MQKKNKLMMQQQAEATDNALRAVALELLQKQEQKAVSEQWADTLNFELADWQKQVEAPSVSVKDVSPGWGLPGSIDEHMAVLWRRSTFARDATAAVNGIGNIDPEFGEEWQPEKQAIKDVMREYSLDPLHPSFQIMRDVRSPEQLEAAAKLIRRNMDQDGYAADNYNGAFGDTLEVGAMFFDPVFMGGGTLFGLAKGGAKSAKLATTVDKGSRAHIWGTTVAVESLAVDAPIEAFRALTDDTVGLADFFINMTVSGMAGYSLGQGFTRMTFNEKVALEDAAKALEGARKARDVDPVSFDEAATTDGLEVSPDAPEGPPKKNPYMGRKSFRGAEEGRGPKPDVDERSLAAAKARDEQLAVIAALEAKMPSPEELSKMPKAKLIELYNELGGDAVPTMRMKKDTLLTMVGGVLPNRKRTVRKAYDSAVSDAGAGNKLQRIEEGRGPKPDVDDRSLAAEDPTTERAKSAWKSSGEFQGILDEIASDRKFNKAKIEELHQSLFPGDSALRGTKKEMLDELAKKRRRHENLSTSGGAETPMPWVSRNETLSARNQDDVVSIPKNPDVEQPSDPKKPRFSVLDQGAVADTPIWVAAQKVLGGMTPPKRNDPAVGRGFGKWTYNKGENVSVGRGYFVPIANLEASPREGVRQLTHIIVPNRGTDSIPQGVTASEAAVRHSDVGAVFQRERIEAASRFFARRGQVNVITGNISDGQINDFNSMVGALIDGIDDLEFHPLFREYGIDPEEFAKDPDVISARQATAEDFDQNRVALQDPNHMHGDNSQGFIHIPDPEAGFSIGDEYLDRLRDWKNSEVSAEPTSSELNTVGRQGLRRGASTGAIIGASLAAPAIGSVLLFNGEALDETSPVAGLALMTIAGAAFGGPRGALRSRKLLRQRRANQRIKWEKAKPGFSVFSDASSPNADLKKLEKAQKLDADGASRDTIWKQTGWFKAAASKEWLFEDVAAYADELTEETIPASLLEILPDDLVVALQREDPWRENVLGAMRTNEDGSLTIRINQKADAGIQVSTLLHEFQHAVQKGQDRLGKIESTFREYLRSQHEAEARLAANRMGMTAQERSAVPPYRMYDVIVDDITAKAADGNPEDVLRLSQALDAVNREGYLAENSKFVGEHPDYGGPMWRVELPEGSAIHYYLAPDGTPDQMEVSWDWVENFDPEMEMTQLDKTSTEMLQAMQLANNMTVQVLNDGTYPLLYFSGLTEGHTRKQRKLLSKHIGGTPYAGYIAETEPKPDGSKKTYYALVRNDIGDAEDRVQALHSSKLKVSETESWRPFNPEAGYMANGVPYEGAEFAHGWVKDPNYFHRSFLGDRVREVLSTPKGEATLAAEIADAAIRSPETIGSVQRAVQKRKPADLKQAMFDEVMRISTNYVKTLREIHNLAKSDSTPNFAPRSQSTKQTAKGIAEAQLGRQLTPEENEAITLFGDILAPPKEPNRPGFSKRKLKMKISAKDHPTLLSILDHDVSAAANKIRAQSAGHVGYLKVGIRDASAVDAAIAKMETEAGFLPDTDSQKRTAEELQMVSRLHDEVMHRAEGPTETVSAIKKLLMSMFLGNVQYSMGGEVFKTMFSAGMPRVLSAITDYGRYREAAAAGRTDELDPLFKLADDLHGGAMIQAATGGNIARIEAREGVVRDGREKGFGKFARKAANATAKFSGMAPSTMYMRATLVGVWARRSLERARKGKPIEASRTLRSRYGLTDDIVGRIEQQLRDMPSTTSPITGQKVSDWSFNSWTDVEARDAFISYLDRVSKQKVQEVQAGEVPHFFKNGPAAALFQLLSFAGSAANNWSRKVYRAVNPLSDTDMRARVHDTYGLFVGLAGSSLFAFAGLAAKVALIPDEEERRAAADEMLQGNSEALMKAIMYTPEVGPYPSGADLLMTTFGQDPLFSRSRNSGLETIGAAPWKSSPITSLPDRALALGQSPFTEEQDFIKSATRMMPMGNSMAVTMLANEVAEKQEQIQEEIFE